jgi:dTMP kinase
VRGLFATFEGVEGAGKSTRCRALFDSLRRMGSEVVHTREPGGPPVSERIRETLLDPSLQVPAMTELLLYLASRSADVDLVIRPSLDAGRHVVCERFSHATIAYQAGGRGLERESVEKACLLATGGLSPDITFLLDIDPEEGLGRLHGRSCRDRIERESLDFHMRVRQTYLELAGREPGIRVIDASLPGDIQDAKILAGFLDEMRKRAVCRRSPPVGEGALETEI